MNVLPDLLISLILALICVAVPWGIRQVKTWQILVIFGVSLALWIIGAALLLGWYPWTDVVDFLVFVGAGILLGRVISAKFWPFLIFLLILSALDITQILLTVRGAAPVTQRASIPAGDFYSNFLLLFPWGKYGIGPVDLLVMAAIGTHWCKKHGPFFLAFVALAIGVIIADVILMIDPSIVLPLIPFLTFGWLCSVAIDRARKRSGAEDRSAPEQSKTSAQT